MAQFFKRILPASVYEKARQVLLFRPNDPNNLVQQVPQKHVEGVGVPRIQGYRFPAPGSQEKPRIPTRYSDDQLYDISFFSKDTRNIEIQDDAVFNTANQATVSLRERRPLAPPNRKPRPKFDYDPTGLRTAKAATQAAVDASLAKYEPDHFPKPEWADSIAEIIADCEKKGIPVHIGRRYKFKTIPVEYNKVQW